MILCSASIDIVYIQKDETNRAKYNQIQFKMKHTMNFSFNSIFNPILILTIYLQFWIPWDNSFIH